MTGSSATISCSNCRYREARSSHRRWYEYPLSLLGLVPFRCPSCDQRFFRRAARR